MTTTTFASPTAALLSQANTWSALQTFGNNISIGGAAFNITSLAKGDVIYYDGTNLVNLAIGSANQVLTVSGGVPAWTGAAVTSVFGRTGVVVAVNTDYATAGLSGTSLSGIYNIGGTPTLTAGLALNGQTLSGAATFSGALTLSATAAFTNSSPFTVANAQTLTVSVTAQTVGAATLTIPNFASVADTFAFITLAQTLSNKTIASPTLSGTVAGTYNIGGTPTLTSDLAMSPDSTRNLGAITTRIGSVISGNYFSYEATTDTQPSIKIRSGGIVQILLGPGGTTAPLDALRVNFASPTILQVGFGFTQVVFNGAPSIEAFRITSAPLLQISSSLAFNVTSVSANTTLAAGTHQVVLDSASGAANTITLPAASAQKGLHIVVIKTDSSANAVTVARAGTDTIEGATSLSLATQYKKAHLVSDGTSVWYDLGASLV